MKDYLDWTKSDLIPACIQDYRTKEILMIGFMNQESFEATLESNEVTFYSRSKKRLWKKGEESGNVLKVVSMRNDCDRDSLVIMVDPAGPTCHTNRPSCFDSNELIVLENTIQNRQKNPMIDSYTNRLLLGPKKDVLKKIGEEATEVIIALAIEGKKQIQEELADLVFHLSVAMNIESVKWDDVFSVLEERRIKNTRLTKVYTKAKSAE